jgi:hypothetical protein
VPGQTNATLNLANVQTIDSGSYFAVVTSGVASTPSIPASLRVLVPQRFVQSPQRLGNGTFRLLFAPLDGSAALAGDLTGFEVWATTNLANPAAWVRITNGISLQNGQVQVDDPDSAALPLRFYRVITR